MTDGFQNVFVVEGESRASEVDCDEISAKFVRIDAKTTKVPGLQKRKSGLAKRAVLFKSKTVDWSGSTIQRGFRLKTF